MTHREKMIAMLDEARIAYGFNAGTNIQTDDVTVVFSVNGALIGFESIYTEAEDDY